jgi:RecB family exonuclease
LDEKPRLQSAVRLLEMQSACPLAAFLAHRLAARFEAMPPVFASPAFTGALVHCALQWLYQPIVDSGQTPRPADIPAAVDAALREKSAERHLLPAIHAAERERIISLLGEWLAFDAGRPATRVVALEHQLQGSLNGFDIELRMDRADRQPDGGLLVIDYKTSSVGKPRWGNERLGDLQLPLYATLLAAAGEDAGGVALAQLRQSDCHLRGISRDAGVSVSQLKEVPRAGQGFADWEQALAAWSQWLDTLAHEYRTGVCSHQLHFDAPLRYAGLEPLLRIAELTAWEAAHADH